jgi:hypothetical protein
MDHENVILKNLLLISSHLNLVSIICWFP